MQDDRIPEAIVVMTESGQISDERKKLLAKGPLGIGAMTGVIASLCCLSPVFLVLFGVLSVSAGLAMGDFLYSNFKLHFILAGVSFMLLGTLFYMRQGSCPTRSDKLSILSGIAVIAVISYLGINTFLTILELLAKGAVR